MPAGVVDHPERHRFELAIEGSDEPAAAYYQLRDDRIVLTHTEVPSSQSGKGIGSTLARGVFDLIRASGRKVQPRCPFMRTWLDRHPEYQDLADPLS